MGADRARDFLTRIEGSNVGAETLDQLIDDLRRLVIAYQQQSLPTLLGDLVDTQNRAFGLLEGRQRPEQTRDLYLITGIACGLMAKASHDLGAVHDAMTHARTGYACADNAGHDGLRAWIRGLQAQITYWSGRLTDSVRYAELGADAAARSRGTAGVWLASSEARTLAALNRLEDAHADAPDEDRAFGDESGTRSALAVARILLGEIDGAAEALAPVLELPPAKRIHGIVASVEHVRTALRSVKDPSRAVTELAGAIEGFTSERLALQG